MQAAKNRKFNTGDFIFDLLIWIFLIFAVLICVYPFVYVVSVAISSGEAVNRGEVILLPVDLNFDALKTVLVYKQLWVSYRNTYDHADNSFQHLFLFRHERSPFLLKVFSV